MPASIWESQTRLYLFVGFYEWDESICKSSYSLSNGQGEGLYVYEGVGEESEAFCQATKYV